MKGKNVYKVSFVEDDCCVAEKSVFSKSKSVDADVKLEHGQFGKILALLVMDVASHACINDGIDYYFFVRTLLFSIPSHDDGPRQAAFEKFIEVFDKHYADEIAARKAEDEESDRYYKDADH